MVCGSRKSRDPCAPRRTPNYFEKFCTTFGPCKGICKPFFATKDYKDHKNCCAYCIKPSSLTKMERHFLKRKTLHDVHCLRPGAMCVVNMEEKYLKDRKARKLADKKLCEEIAERMGDKKKNLLQSLVMKKTLLYLKKIECFIKNKKRELRQKICCILST